MPQLMLHARHQQGGACFSPYGAWMLPDHYGDFSSEYRAVRKNAGIADLSYQGMLLVSGEDRIPFLQNLASNDLKLLTNERGIYSTLLTAKAKMVADFYLYALPEAILIEMEGAEAEAVSQYLTRYKFRSRIKIESPAWGKILISGPDGGKALQRFLGKLPAEEKSFIQREIEGTIVVCVKRSMTGEEDYRLFIPEAALNRFWGKLLEAGAEFGMIPIGHAALETLRIEAGRPYYGIDMDEEIKPIEAGLKAEAISDTKGCYPGQEVIARVETYGSVKKHLYGLLLEGSDLPKKGDKIFQEEKEVGWVTSATPSPFLNKVIAMGYVRSSVAIAGATSGANIEVEVNQVRRAAQVVPLPFYRRR